jgi:hypothetical protein
MARACCFFRKAEQIVPEFYFVQPAILEPLETVINEDLYTFRGFQKNSHEEIP